MVNLCNVGAVTRIARARMAVYTRHLASIRSLRVIVAHSRISSNTAESKHTAHH